MAKKELAVINLDQFSIQQLPELKNKKEEVAQKLSTFKYVKITDNASYEESKKVRTGVRTVRTDLQKEQKAVDKKIKDFILGPVKDAYEEIINEVLTIENMQQEEVTRWEDIKEQERLEKQRIEQERIRNIKTYISIFEQKAYEIIESSTIENVNENKAILDELVNAEFDFQEFLVEFEQARVRLQYRFDVKCDEIQEKENQRLENERLAKEKAEADEKLRKIQEQQEKERQEAEAKFQAIELQREKERAEREEKARQEQLQMFEIRKRRLGDIGVILTLEGVFKYIDFETECVIATKQEVINVDLIGFEELITSASLSIEKAKEELEANKVAEEVVEPAPIIYPAFGDQSETILQDITEEPKVAENSWEYIHDLFTEESEIDDSINFYYWLKENYNVPTKK